MCSIIGYCGDSIAAPIIVTGLQGMEYRGYDSVGIATVSNNQLLMKKGSGRVAEVNGTLQLEKLSGIVGIGHTRWATHGKPNSINAHPHVSSSNKIAIVHNGIIDNFQQIKEKLQKNGFIFKSDTDSEVIANLLEYHYLRVGNVKETVIRCVAELKGEYAFVAMFENGTIAAARFHEPLIIGIGNHGFFVSSDVLGFVNHTDEVIYPENREFVIINHNEMKMYNFDGMFVQHNIVKVAKELTNAQKGNFPHYTIKEISEQPHTVLQAGLNSKNEIGICGNKLKKSTNILFTGSGTSYNACLVGKYILLNYAKIRSECLMSSEIPFTSYNFGSKTLLLALSQSGESADVIESVNIAKKNKAEVISIVNVSTSTLAKMSSTTIKLNCGPEIGVAATKSFTSQLVVLYKILEKITNNEIKINFNEISEKIKSILGQTNNIEKIAQELRNSSDIYIIGRGIHYPIACESALKLKELTYMHAEAIPAGELKHGPLALMDSKTYVIVFNPTDQTYYNTLSSIHEIKARGAKIIGVSDKPNSLYDYWVKIPKISHECFPILEIIPIQILSYFTALEKNTDPDYPRNLAKSVTVK